MNAESFEQSKNPDHNIVSDQGLNFTARRLNYLAEALSCDRYLEIGVETGHTFFQVACREKTGVDPSFLFDWEQAHGSNGVKLYNTSSDQFFHDLNADVTYDLIFVDGLHTFEQTYRDILHAIMHSHPRTVILVDDTIPSDVFSTCRDQQECLNLRASLYGPGDNRWHGDTYKVIPLLSVFNTDFEIATIADNGNPQTLLWRTPSTPKDNEIKVLQAMWAVQNMAAADYLWLLNNYALYNPLSEQKALESVIYSIAPFKRV